MKRILLILSILFGWLFVFSNNFVVANSYTDTLNAIWWDEWKAWEISATLANDAWGESLKWLMINVAKKIIMPIVIVLWLLIAFLWFYKLAFSDKEDERKKWLNFAIWWTLWVVLMSSSYFIVDALVWTTWTSWIIWTNSGFDPATIANNLYAWILRKFFVLAMYFIMGILFITLLITVIKLIWSGDKEDMTKHSKTIIVWNSLWIIIIIFAQNIINMFYSKVTNWASSLWQQQAILESKNIWWLYTVLNYFLWFVWFIITVFIIYQAYLLLAKPDDDATYKNLKKYFVYIILWILLIGWVYIIANFFIVQ